MTEGQGRASTSQSALPAGVRERQAWRPPMLATLDALLVGVVRRSEPLLRKVSDLVVWHEQLAQRAEPWSVWHPLPLPLHAETPAAEHPPARPVDRISPGVADSPGAWAFGESDTPMLSARPMRPHPLPPDSAPPLPGRPAARRPAGYDLPFSRPSVRLASLQRAADASAEAADGPARGRPAPQPRAPSDLNGRAWPAAERPAPRFGPILATSPAPRQEIRGGFPARPLPAEPASPGARMRSDGLPSSVPPRSQYPPTARPAADSAASHVPTLPQPSVQVFPPSALPPLPSGDATDARGIVEQLIERTRLPSPLPGLEVRLVSPEQRITSEARTPADAPPPASPEESRPAEPAPPPPLNIDALADRIYQTLQRRQQLERERRGLY